MSRIRINLLPHRQQKRLLQQRLMALLAIFIALAALLVVYAGQVVIDDAKHYQSQRNDLLRQEIAALNRQIDEIRTLKDKTKALLERKAVVESLQANRYEIVRLFDQLARKMPEGVYLTSLKQAGNSVTLQGVAQSNAWVSNLMRNLDESPLFASPNLIEVRSTQLGTQRVSAFTIIVAITGHDEVQKAQPAERGA